MNWEKSILVSSVSFDLGVEIAVFLRGALNAPPPKRMIGLRNANVQYFFSNIQNFPPRLVIKYLHPTNIGLMIVPDTNTNL